jgi:hypothetical protein
MPRVMAPTAVRGYTQNLKKMASVVVRRGYTQNLKKMASVVVRPK